MTDIRHFDGAADWIDLALGNLDFAFGPGTIAWIGLHTEVNGVDQGVFGMDVEDGDPVWSLFFVHYNGTGTGNENRIALYNGLSVQPSHGPQVAAADGVVCCASSKPTGDAVIRTYLYNYGTETGAHTDGIDSVSNPLIPSIMARIGDDANGADPFTGDLLIVGLWDVVLSDVEKEALPLSIDAWTAVTPRGLWLLNQASTSDPVIDLTGGGADQTAISGTSVGSSAFPPDEFFGAAPSAPTNTVPPAVTGTLTQGQLLSCTTGTWTDSPTGYTYQWKRADLGTNIGGATASTYTLVAGDVGHTIKCTVTATNATGSTNQDSNTTGAISAPPAAPVNTVAPAITGTPETGSTLTCSNGTWTGDATISFTFQWKRGGVNISGETANTYLLDVADEGANITCSVTGTNGAGNATAASNTVVPSAPPVAGNTVLIKRDGLWVETTRYIRRDGEWV